MAKNTSNNYSMAYSALYFLYLRKYYYNLYIVNIKFVLVNIVCNGAHIIFFFSENLFDGGV